MVPRRIAIFGCLSLLASLLLAGMAHAEAAGKKALVIVASKDFEDSEYADTRRKLDSADVIVTIASTQEGKAAGRLGKKVAVDMILDQAKAADFDAVVFIGGGGAMKELWGNPQAQRLAKEAAEQGKILAAICAAPVVLAQAGVLQGKSSTVNGSVREEFVKNGCVPQNESVVTDGKIITANGPDAAKKFGEAIVNAL